MPTLVVVLALVTAVAAPAAAAESQEPVHAEMLLDLDLLHAADPRVPQEPRLSESRSLLEFLQHLERASIQRPRGYGRTPKDAC